MITEVSICCPKKPGGWYTAYTRVYPPNTPLDITKQNGMRYITALSKNMAMPIFAYLKQHQLPAIKGMLSDTFQQDKALNMLKYVLF